MLFSSKPPYPNIELLSVHLPKTAGVSFSRTLENIYTKSLKKVYAPKLIQAINQGTSPSLPKKARCVHGHFGLLPHTLDWFPNAKLICWLRNPIDRVVSHYNYWLSYPAHGNSVHDRFLKEQPSLLAFAQNAIYIPTVNAYQSFLGDFTPNQFCFVGRTESFKDDLYKLASLMGWSKENLVFNRENVAHKENQISQEEKEALGLLLKDEIALYKSFISYFHSSSSKL